MGPLSGPDRGRGGPEGGAAVLHPRTLLTETLLVLGVSLGGSALWSLLALVRKVTEGGPLASQTTTMNASLARSPWLDLAYQLTGVALGVVPALLALHLLSRGPDHRPGPVQIGLDLRRPGADLVRGAALAAVIGLPGLALYLGARAAGLNTSIAAADLQHAWWTVPVLVLAAVQNAVLEEVVMVGYLLTRWRQVGWSPWPVVWVSALVRGGYHLYQGFGGGVGNLAMGLLLGWVYLRTGRVGPLVVAHALLDVVAFVGYAALAARVGWL